MTRKRDKGRLVAALRFQLACVLAVPEEAQYEQHEDHD
jgi:hypothetical protein